MTKKPTIGWIANSLTAEMLSADMTGNYKASLNVLSQNATIDMIRKVCDLHHGKTRVAGLYVDTVGDPDRYQGYLSSVFPYIGKIVVAKKADSLFKIVSAASVVAKVSRDTMLDNYEF